MHAHGFLVASFLLRVFFCSGKLPFAAWFEVTTSSCSLLCGRSFPPLRLDRVHDLGPHRRMHVQDTHPLMHVQDNSISQGAKQEMTYKKKILVWTHGSEVRALRPYLIVHSSTTSPCGRRVRSSNYRVSPGRYVSRFSIILMPSFQVTVS